MSDDFGEVKHISLDAWNTLLIPSKEYAQVRTKVLADIFDCSYEFAKATYSSVKKKFDNQAEERGAGFSTPYIYRELVRSFPSGCNVNADELRVLHLEQCFKESPPEILAETIAQISRLKKKGITFSIGSNTNFISGQILGPLIKTTVPDFDFMMFSDLTTDCGDTCYAKPNYCFFARVHSHVNVLHGEKVDIARILHIGDNRVCDFQGAASYGFSSQLIDNAYCLPDVLKEL